MISVRNYFDDLIVHHLGQNASIVDCPDFETDVLKVLKGQVKLTLSKKNALTHFYIGSTSDASMQVTREDDEASVDETDVKKCANG